MNEIRTIVVDDDPECIDHLSLLLEQHPEINIQLASSNPLEALSIIRTMHPDLLFLDIEMPGISGLEFAGVIKEMHHEITVIFVTGYNQYAIQAIKKSAYDYLLKPLDPEELADTLNRFCKERMSGESILEHLQLKFPLTSREIEVIDKIRLGLTTEQIASRLNLSALTVKTHRQNILRKTSCVNFSELLGGQHL